MTRRLRVVVMAASLMFLIIAISDLASPDRLALPAVAHSSIQQDTFCENAECRAYGGCDLRIQERRDCNPADNMEKFAQWLRNALRTECAGLEDGCLDFSLSYYIKLALSLIVTITVSIAISVLIAVNIVARIVTKIRIEKSVIVEVPPVVLVPQPPLPSPSPPPEQPAPPPASAVENSLGLLLLVGLVVLLIFVWTAYTG